MLLAVLGALMLMAADLPTGSAPPPVPIPHFSDRLHAGIWRNWTLIPIERLAKTLGAKPEETQKLGRPIGLWAPPRISAEQQRRSYLIDPRRNWHLLPYDPLLTLLSWTPERMAYAPRADDFLYIKLGSLKPRCEPLRHHPSDVATWARGREIMPVVWQEFPGGRPTVADPLFDFVRRHSAPRPEEPEAESATIAHAVIASAPAAAPSRFSTRFCYSYFALYGDPLLEKAAEPYPDGDLPRLARAGVNGVWLPTVLSRLDPFPWEPALSTRYPERLRNPRPLAARARCGTALAPTKAGAKALRATLAQTLTSEVALAHGHYTLQVRDSRRSLEASNHYAYGSLNPREKIVACRDLQDRWLHAQRARFAADSESAERAALQQEMQALEARLDALRRLKNVPTDRIADATLYAKGVDQALRYDADLTPADLNLMRAALERGNQRATALESGQAPWERKKGRLVRGYVSSVDGSVQPYGLVIPAGYAPTKPIRLDVVLHGSTRPAGMSELRFIAPFDEGDQVNDGGEQIPVATYIELHPLGRVENCYRWAGESDVFEAIEDVCHCYNIDRDRIVLRGMSMGASGAWHLGLKHPDYFVALGPYSGYVDTHRFSETPGMDFVKVGPLPPHQEATLHMLDSVDYAANAGIVPAIAAIGERDPFFQAHVIMGEAMQREGLKMVNLISPGTAHVQDPGTWGEQMRQIGVFADKGRDHLPRHLRFVTWTLKYARCYWIELLGLRRHYGRAEIDATVMEDNTIRIAQPINITRFAILPPLLTGRAARLTIGGHEVRLPRRSEKDADGGIVLERRGATWRVEGHRDTVRLTGKRPGLQGPIDDAFTTTFLCVRGTGKPWSPAVQTWADANLRRFAYEWRRYFRGELPIKNDTEVTAEDCRRCNLILFGDPGSNLWIGKALGALPIRWTREAVQVGASRYLAADHAPALICPSPFAAKEAPRYLVINSGHTFHEAELNRLNYLLFPRLGDWAVFKVGAGQPENPSAPLQEEVLLAGFWNERWKP